VLFGYKIKPNIPLYLGIKSRIFSRPPSTLLTVADLRHGGLQSVTGMRPREKEESANRTEKDSTSHSTHEIGHFGDAKQRYMNASEKREAELERL